MTTKKLVRDPEIIRALRKIVSMAVGKYSDDPAEDICVLTNYIASEFDNDYHHALLEIVMRHARESAKHRMHVRDKYFRLRSRTV